jgi:hypothetical protein
MSDINLEGKKKKGYKNTGMKKVILGKERCIYKIAKDRKEYVKYKGELITVKMFKEVQKPLKRKSVTKKLIIGGLLTQTDINNAIRGFTSPATEDMEKLYIIGKEFVTQYNNINRTNINRTNNNRTNNNRTKSNRTKKRTNNRTKKVSLEQINIYIGNLKNKTHVADFTVLRAYFEYIHANPGNLSDNCKADARIMLAYMNKELEHINVMSYYNPGMKYTLDDVYPN